MLLLNVTLALIWMALNAAFGPADFVVGFVLGFLIIALTQRTLGHGNYGNHSWRVVTFIWFGLSSVVKSNLDIARLVLRPNMDVRPAIIAVPLDIEGDGAITLLANLITLTPGTLSLDVSSDRRTLYVHAIVVDDPEAFRREIKQEFERRVQEVMRP